MTLLTGLYPVAHGVMNLGDGPDLALSRDVRTMAELLTAEGYLTGAHTAGGHVSQVLGFDRGFGSYSQGGSVEAIFARAASLAEQFVTRRASFFIFVHTYQIHDPYVPPSRFQIFSDQTYSGAIVGDGEELRRLAGDEWSRQHEVYWSRVRHDDPHDLQRLQDLYDASILYTDVQLGRLLDRLRSSGAYDDSLIIVLSDHGEEFGDHGGYLHNTVYEEILRVPLIIRFPRERGSAWRGHRVADVVRLVDVLPTILEYLRLPAPRQLQGESFLSLIHRPGTGRTRPVWAQWPRLKKPGPESLRLEHWKLIENGRSAGVQLFDLVTDPRELRDLASAEAVQVGRMREILARLSALSLELRAGSAAGEAVAISPELEQQLRALGYLR
jgi:arylsulfatase A-like enzyme